jgi:hypothetical protein
LPIYLSASGRHNVLTFKICISDRGTY